MNIAPSTPTAFIAATISSPVTCEEAVVTLGGECGELNKETQALVVGVYATESWLHSSWGTKTMRASTSRADGAPISIVGEPARDPSATLGAGLRFTASVHPVAVLGRRR